jgi:hypothetical protein
MPNKILDQFFERCPRSGGIVGIRYDTPVTRALFPVLGLLATGWFLLRVIPKPSRAEYPCQKVAAGLGAGFLAYAASLLATCAGFRFLRRRVGQAAAVAVVVALGTVAHDQLGLSQPPTTEKIAQVLTPAEGPNHPIGQARGMNPGRVVWAQDFAATLWDGQTGNWWEEKNVSQPEVEKMFSRSLQALTGAPSDRQAWDGLFRYYNKTAGRGDHGYQKGEKVLVKLNCNADEGTPWSNNGYPTPHVVYTLVRQLTEVAGVPADRIILSDPSRNIGNPIYSKVRSNSAFQQVTFEGQLGEPAPQRVKPAPDLNAPIYFDMPAGQKGVMYLPRSHTDATYLISYALIRPHRVFGVTLSAKNYYGSVFDTELKIFKPSFLHAFAIWDYPTPNKMGESHSLPALLGHRQLGGKTILFFADGLYTSYNQVRPVVKWSTLNDRWFSGMLMSQDPVALDSVGYDLIRSEPRLTNGNPSFNGNVDNYMHEAALADHPPSGTKYDPENKGTVLGSLGAHEHWNSVAEKKYSRNLGRKEGIELVAVR